ncbi:hypothetical protein P3576_26925, partial [Vibrio parahaemolyticus]|nr:hypothetical protein [Vibrio parahaemolyticus]
YRNINMNDILKSLCHYTKQPTSGKTMFKNASLAVQHSPYTYPTIHHEENWRPLGFISSRLWIDG